MPDPGDRRQIFRAHEARLAVEDPAEARQHRRANDGGQERPQHQATRRLIRQDTHDAVSIARLRALFELW